MTKTYYEVIHQETEKPLLVQERKRGTEAYGYKTLANAIAFCPVGYMVRERFCSNSDDWSGAIVHARSDLKAPATN